MGSDPITAHGVMQPITCRHGDPGVVGQPIVADIAGPLGAGSDGQGHRVDAEGAANGHLIVQPVGMSDVTHALTGEGADASEDGTGRGTPLVIQAIPILEPGRRSGRSTIDPSIGFGIGAPGDPMYTTPADRPHGVAQPLPFDTTQITSAENRSNPGHGDPCHPLAAHAHAHAHAHAPAIALGVDLQNVATTGDLAGTMSAEGAARSNRGPAAMQHMLVRRLMPVECERLQGYPDGHTAVPRGAAGKVMHDGPRYKAIGNGWARPVFEWVGRRIDRVTGGDR